MPLLLPLFLGPMLGPMLSLIAALPVAEGSARGVGSLTSLTARVFGPRMDYDEWTPLGHGDPLKNDPTFDYVPPVLDRVHYWMEPKESTARRDEVFNNVPVPPTMLVPPPPPPPPPPPALATTTTATPLTPAPPAAASYSSLNPFHHFEDRPVVPNVLFEEKPLSFEAPQRQPPHRAPPLQDKPGRDSPSLLTSPPPPASGNVVFLDVEKQHLEQPLLRPLAAADSPLRPHAGPPMSLPALPGPVRLPSKQPNGPNAIRHDNKQGQNKMVFPARGKPKPVPTTTPSTTTTSTTTPATTTTDNSISSLVRGLLHPEVPTTVPTMTTDPLFAHYKQPATPVNVNGPAYLIIQGHSKVKTYGPVIRRYDPPHGPPDGLRGAPGLRGPQGTPGRRHAGRAP